MGSNWEPTGCQLGSGESLEELLAKQVLSLPRAVIDEANEKRAAKEEDEENKAITSISHQYHNANSYQVDTSFKPVSHHITEISSNLTCIVLRIKNGGILAQKWGKRGLHPNIQWKPSITGDKKAKRLQILMRTSEFTNGKAPILYQFLSFLN